MGFFKRFMAERAAMKKFNALPRAERRIVFYAESRADWPHLGPVVEHLTQDQGHQITYLTSDESDPILHASNDRILPLYIGSGTVRTLLFKALDCDVFVLTLPDLETYHLKRSVHPVHYVYIYHSINSTHRVYRKGAFDAYDTVLCVGPHHVDEIRATENAYGLKPKALVEHGYGRLDAIIERQKQVRESFQPSSGPSKRVLLAPSWGECSFIENPVGTELIQNLLNEGHTVNLRLHPMTVRHHPKLVSEMQARFADPRFTVETDMNEQDSLHRSDIMISDWSGAAFEFAFGLERPVLFMNTTPKINNPEHDRISAVPLEASIRTEIGDVLEPAEIASAGEKISKLCQDPEAFRTRIREARDRWIFNIGKSGEVGALAISAIAEKLRGRSENDSKENHTAQNIDHPAGTGLPAGSP